MKRLERAKMLRANAAFARAGLEDAIAAATDPATKAQLRAELVGKTEEFLMLNDLVDHYQSPSLGTPEEVKGG